MSQTFKVSPGGILKGKIKIPGDKSISHRAVMMSAIAEGNSKIAGFLTAKDCLATVDAFRAMNVSISDSVDDEIIIHGVGLHGLKPSQSALDLGNSGTSMRLLAGLLAPQNFSSELTGDSSLLQRPMARIVDPLRQMGAEITLQNNAFPPLKLQGQKQLQAIDYQLPLASAQVKSCLLFAGLYAKGMTIIDEPIKTRDHTERMFKNFGVELTVVDKKIKLNGGQKLIAKNISVPGDISSAAFFIVGATIAKNSELVLENIGINLTRIGIIEILRQMGAEIELFNQREIDHESVADIRVCSSELHGVNIPAHLVPLAIDEFPIIFIAAACARGETILRGASELRVKESDRIQAMAAGLKILGIEVETFPDGIRIQGGHLQGGRINSFGDHRIAMAFAMAGLNAREEIIIDNCLNVSTSFPNFVELAQAAGLDIRNQFHGYQ